MRKIWIVAAREYKAAVRTKAFLIGLLIMPIMMGASVLLQWLLKDMVDTETKHFVLVDRAGRSDIVKMLDAAYDAYNKTAFDSAGVQRKPLFQWASAAPAPDLDLQRLELSQQVRTGKLIGFLEILTREQAGETGPSPIYLRYYTNRVTFVDFSTVSNVAVSEYLRATLAGKFGLDRDDTQALLKPVELENKPLLTRNAEGGIEEGSEQSRFTSLIVPSVLMLMMFMVVLMGSTPLMQSVVEEKMQRIAEVLLGSVPPFELMLGKLIGMTGVSLTIAAVYLTGAYWAATHFGFGEGLTADLLLWFVAFQACASLMFGSLFIAIGAACSEMKETQAMVLPVMLLASLPMFLLGTVMREPNGPVVRGFSFFPFATPSLMIGRLAALPNLSWWEPALGMMIVLSTTLLCVYVASRIFRVGLLLQGKRATVREIVRWIIKG